MGLALSWRSSAHLDDHPVRALATGTQGDGASFFAQSIGSVVDQVGPHLVQLAAERLDEGSTGLYL